MAKKYDADKLIKDTSTFAGGAAGGAIGAIIAGPGGAVVGAFAGTVFERMFCTFGQEIKDRVLSNAERRKVDNVYDAAKAKIKENLSNGKVIRDDDFFEEKQNDRSAADEILEGILFAAQRECEEKKIPFIGNLFANIAFDKSVSRTQANQLIKVAQVLTYEQLIIIEVIGGNQQILSLMSNFAMEQYSFRKTAYGTVSGYENIAVLTETFNLIQQGVVYASEIPLTVASINPSTLTIGGIGEQLYNYMELSTLQAPEKVQEIRRVFTLGK